MKFVASISDQVKAQVAPVLDIAKKRLLGANNERLDFVMDSFYKLSPSQQKAAIIGIMGGVAFVLMGALAIYFSRISALETELNQGFTALEDLRALGAEFRMAHENFDSLSKTITRKTQDLKPKPFFEQKANQLNVKIESLRSEEVDFPADNPLAKQFKNLVVEFRLPKVSIPKMLMFLGEIEKADKTMTVSNLQIRARYGDRLYFDVTAKVTGFAVGSANK
jgi:hypothetical protein